MAERRRVPVMTVPCIVGTGLITLDLIYRGDAKVPLSRAAGGTCGNVLAILAYLGWRAVPVSRLDDDVAGDLVEADLKSWGVDVRFLRMEPRAPTPIIAERIRRRDGRVVHSFLFACQCCGAMLPRFRAIRLGEADSVVAAIAKPTVFFFDRASPASVRMAKTYAANGGLVVFEPSSVGEPRTFEAALAASHVVKYSEQRMGGLPVTRPTGRRLEIQTRGADGLRYRVAEGRRLGSWLTLPSLPAPQVLDTAGAGDWCTAGLLLQAGSEGVESMPARQIEQALRYGQAMSAWNCRFEGARGGMYEHSSKEMRREVEAILSGSSVSAEPEHVELDCARTPVSICPACDRSPAPGRRAELGRPARSSSLRPAGRTK